MRTYLVHSRPEMNSPDPGLFLVCLAVRYVISRCTEDVPPEKAHTVKVTLDLILIFNVIAWFTRWIQGIPLVDEVKQARFKFIEKCDEIIHILCTVNGIACMRDIVKRE